MGPVCIVKSFATFTFTIIHIISLRQGDNLKVCIGVMFPLKNIHYLADDYLIDLFIGQAKLIRDPYPVM